MTCSHENWAHLETERTPIYLPGGRSTGEVQVKFLFYCRNCLEFREKE